MIRAQNPRSMSQFIDGKRCESLSGQSDVVRDPSNGTVVERSACRARGRRPRGAGGASRVPEWANATPVDRSAVLTTFARLLGERGEEFAQLESRQAGKPIRLAREFDVPGTIDNVAFFAGAARNLEGKASAEYSADHTSSIRREPVGVVGSIAPWNYPLQMAAWKVLPAIAAGNTIVLKPAELTPLTSLLFAEIAAEAGLPPGVFNVLTGTGTDVDLCCCATKTSTWCLSPAPPESAVRCSRRRPLPRSVCTSSSAARRRSWSSMMPTLKPPCTVRSPAA